MNFVERSNFIGNLLREKILKRLNVPKEFDSAKSEAEVTDMVADLNATWPVMSDEMFFSVADRFIETVRRSHRTRTWPTIGELCTYLKRALEPAETAPAKRLPAVGCGTDWRTEIKVRQLKAWIAGAMKGLPEDCLRREICILAGLSEAETARLIKIPDDPFHWGIDDGLTHEQRLAQRVRYQNVKRMFPSE